jgi:hypothetical protein
MLHQKTEVVRGAMDRALLALYVPYSLPSPINTHNDSLENRLSSRLKVIGARRRFGLLNFFESG